MNRKKPREGYPHERYEFRGYSKELGEWVEGFLFWDKKPYICHPVFPKSFEVVPSSIGQCTGFRDSNGKRIYEGDIVKCIPWTHPDKGWEAVVEWRHGAFVLVSERHPELGLGLCIEEGDYIYVVGNIYDRNPDLWEAVR